MHERGDGPLRLVDANGGEGRVGTKSKALIGINSNVPCAFETAAFKGHMLFYVNRLPSTPPALFKGHKRRTHLVVKVMPSLPVPLEEKLGKLLWTMGIVSCKDQEWGCWTGNIQACCAL